MVIEVRKGEAFEGRNPNRLGTGVIDGQFIGRRAGARGDERVPLELPDE